MSSDTLSDGRSKGFFWIEDALFDVHAPKIGVYGVAVYCLLARMSNSEKVCWPSYSYIAKQLKISRRTAMRVVSELIALGLLKVETKQSLTPDGKIAHDSNRYTLQNARPGSVSESPPSDSQSPPVVTHSHHPSDSQSPKGIHKEGIHNKGRGDATKNAELHYLNNETRQIVHTLMSIEKWDKNEAQTLEMVSVSKTSFPQVDLSHVATTLSYKIKTGAVQYKKPSRAFPNWVSCAAERVTASPPERPRIRAEER